MGKKKIDTVDDNNDDIVGTEDDISASEKDLELAFESGYDNTADNIQAAPKSAPSTDEDDDKKVIDNNVDKDLKNQANDDDNIDDDEWAGVSPALKARFTQMESQVLKATNTANSASGRAGKLQKELDKRLAESQPKPQPTSEQIKEAMGNPEKLTELADQWPDLVAGITEGLQNVGNVVGNQIDIANTSMMEAWEKKRVQADEDLLNHVKIDIAHKGWQNTINGKDFNVWFYEGGPTSEESGKYSQLRALENSSKKTGTPEATAALAKEASDFYTHLLDLHPVWAGNKGNLYGSPSIDAAIELLDMFEDSSKPPQNADADANADADRDKRKKILADNVAPTDGQGRSSPTHNQESADEAFLNGFNGSGR